MWHNMLTSKVLFDRDGQYAATRQRLDVPFPEELRRNIINRNMRLFTGNLPSYDARPARPRAEATKSRSTIAWPPMESYFDVLFALNRRTIPARSVSDKLAERDCAILPKDFAKTSIRCSIYGRSGGVQRDFGEIVDDLRQWSTRTRDLIANPAVRRR